ncbi:nitroreductase family protein [Ectobacillus ponti]|uniref:Nitroreductase family protein n=1 Tax=Ectobacillus ponti TaxID=2961894 RepID=A0AA41X9Q4_9BACI|nr:nitroreductase family protein [Ectobacillus ponti]MCP8969289.1 nitroreductase family protein [Ectobacillus ponti]
MIEVFTVPLAEVVRARSSVRAYHREPIAKEVLHQLETYMEQARGKVKAGIRLEMIDVPSLEQEKGVKLGTYGVIRGTSTFIVPAVQRAEMDLEHMGYIMEHAVLYAASLGLGTCWLGGTFTRSEFGKALEIREGEYIPAIIALGYPRGGRDLLGSLMRAAAGSKSRKPWQDVFFDRAFTHPLTPEEAGAFAQVLELVRLAPSGSNKQPWRIVRDRDRYHFYLAHTKGYSSSRGFSPQRIDIGIAMCHFELAAEELGEQGRWVRQEPHGAMAPPDTEYVISWMQEGPEGPPAAVKQQSLQK